MMTMTLTMTLMVVLNERVNDTGCCDPLTVHVSHGVMSNDQSKLISKPNNMVMIFTGNASTSLYSE